MTMGRWHTSSSWCVGRLGGSAAWSGEGRCQFLVGGQCCLLVVGADGHHVVVPDDGVPSASQLGHLVRHGPAGTLVEVAAKRKVLAAFRSARYGRRRRAGLHVAVQLLAVVWSHHPDFRDAWLR